MLNLLQRNLWQHLWIAMAGTHSHGAYSYRTQWPTRGGNPNKHLPYILQTNKHLPNIVQPNIPQPNILQPNTHQPYTHHPNTIRTSKNANCLMVCSTQQHPRHPQPARTASSTTQTPANGSRKPRATIICTHQPSILPMVHHLTATIAGFCSPNASNIAPNGAIAACNLKIASKIEPHACRFNG